MTNLKNIIHAVSLAVVMFKFLTIVAATPQVPCYFIFGDSLVDDGNNNNLVTLAKANYPPYGIDFVDGYTGRFTNGPTTADYVGNFLGFSGFIPPFSTARGQEILQGVNYGSGGAGIRDETGQNLGGRVSLDQQILNHQITISRIAILLGGQATTTQYLSKCIYTVGMGSNDYINNYFMPEFYLTSKLFTPEQYAAALIVQYKLQLKALYNLGARKIAVFGLGFVGCAPKEIQRFPPNGTPCVDKINNAVFIFNSMLKPMVDSLNNELPNSKYTFINITSIQSADPAAAGITVVNAPCCILRSDGQCAANTTPCPDRSKYAFFDGFHPTSIVNYGTAARAYNAAAPEDASPVDINHLAQL